MWSVKATHSFKHVLGSNSGRDVEYIRVPSEAPSVRSSFHYIWIPNYGFHLLERAVLFQQMPVFILSPPEKGDFFLNRIEPHPDTLSEAILPFIGSSVLPRIIYSLATGYETFVYKNTAIGPRLKKNSILSRYTSKLQAYI